MFRETFTEKWSMLPAEVFQEEKKHENMSLLCCIQVLLRFSVILFPSLYG